MSSTSTLWFATQKPSLISPLMLNWKCKTNQSKNANILDSDSLCEELGIKIQLNSEVWSLFPVINYLIKSVCRSRVSRSSQQWYSRWYNLALCLRVICWLIAVFSGFSVLNISWGKALVWQYSRQRIWFFSEFVMIVKLQENTWSWCYQCLIDPFTKSDQLQNKHIIVVTNLMRLLILLIITSRWLNRSCN